MTLDQLKSLKVGQVVKYTDDVDKLNVDYWKVRHINDFLVEMIALNKEGVCLLLKFDELDIEYTASLLTIDRPLWDKMGDKDRQLRLVEAKIRDAEFDLECMYRLQHTDTMSGKVSMGTIREQDVLLKEMQQDLITLRNQRNALICPNSDHTN